MLTASTRDEESVPSADALTVDPDASAGYLVRRAQQRHTRLWSQRVGSEMTGPQFAVAVAIAMEPGLDQRTIGRLASLDKSSTADIVARLSRGGWLVVANSADDARRKALSLTPLGLTALMEVTRRASLVQRDLVAPLQKGTEREAFLSCLQRVAFAGAVPPSTQDVAAPTGATVPLLTLHTTPGHLLRRSQQVHALLWAEEVQGATSSPQYAVLNALNSYPDGLDQTTVGEKAALDKSNLADVVRRLVARGAVTRQHDPADGRRRILMITDAARAELNALAPSARRVQARLLEPLDEPDKVQLLHGLALLAYSHGPAAANVGIRSRL